MGDSRTARSVTFRTVVILFVLLLALESFLQYENNRSNSYATTAATISNIQEVVVKNEENIQTLSDTLNEEYKVPLPTPCRFPTSNSRCRITAGSPGPWKSTKSTSSM